MENEVQPVLRLGYLVRTKQRFGFQPAGTLCLVYDEYDFQGRSGVSLITRDGVNLGGFGYSEHDQFFGYVKHTGFKYLFTNNAQLQMDWNNGVFIKFFESNK